MKKRMKQLAVVGLTGAMLLGSSMTAFAGTWTVDGAVQTQQAAGIDLSWVRNEDGSVNWDLGMIDGEEMYSFGSPIDRCYDFTEAEIPGFYTQMIDMWAQGSERGAKWKQLFDRYGLPSYLGSYITPLSGSLYLLDYTLTLPAGITASEIDGIAAAFNFILEVGQRYYGCDRDGFCYTWETNSDGILVVHFTGTIDDNLGAW